MPSRPKKARPQERYVPPLLRFWRDFTHWIEGETGLPAEEQLGRTLYAGIEGRERPELARRLFRKATSSRGENDRMRDLWTLCERVRKHLAIIVARVIDDPSNRCRCPAEGSAGCSCNQDFNVQIARPMQMYRLAGPITRAFAKRQGPWTLYEENLYAVELDVVRELSFTFADLAPAVRRLEIEARRRRGASREIRLRTPEPPGGG